MRSRAALAAAVLALISMGLGQRPAAATPLADPTSATTAGQQNQVSRIVVAIESGTEDLAAAARSAVSDAADAVSAAEVTTVHQITTDTAVVSLDRSLSASTADAVSRIAAQAPGVASVEVPLRIAPAATDDTYFDWQWNLTAAFGVRAPSAWSVTKGAGSVIGVIDTGITANSDLIGAAKLLPGYDFISDPGSAGDGDAWDSNAQDEGDWRYAGDACGDTTKNASSSSWHGTHVAGIAAATANNGTLIAGVAPAAKIEPIRVLGRCGGSSDDLAAAIRWGAGLRVTGVPLNAHPADVLNLSLSGKGACRADSATQKAINAAVAAGVTVVAAVGNGGGRVADYFPANCKNVIAVTASTASGELAGYSNRGDTTRAADLAAPGGSGVRERTGLVVSTGNAGSTVPGAEKATWMAGTSMAAPHVAAVVALLRSVKRSLTPAEILTVLTSTATPLHGSCSRAGCGAGIVNAAAAVRASISTSIVGGSRVGLRITATPRFAFLTSQRIGYQWRRNGSAIPGATGRSYTPTVQDLGTRITVATTAVLGGTTTTTTSNAISVTKAQKLLRRSSPRVIGTFQTGRILRATAGSWSPKPGRVTYRWLRSGKPIVGATSARYRLSRADLNRKVSVRVTVAKPGLATTSATSPGRVVR